MSAKTQQLQIRVTPEQKAALKRLAEAAGTDVSDYVLRRAIPEARSRVDHLVRQVGNPAERPYSLAALNDLLEDLSSAELRDATAEVDLGGLAPYERNYVTAMVELAAARRGIAPPAWTRDVPPLSEPVFATTLAGLRPHLLRASPVPFKRRNIFIDASLGDRV